MWKHKQNFRRKIEKHVDNVIHHSSHYCIPFNFAGFLEEENGRFWLFLILHIFVRILLVLPVKKRVASVVPKNLASEETAWLPTHLGPSSQNILHCYSETEGEVRNRPPDTPRPFLCVFDVYFNVLVNYIRHDVINFIDNASFD